MNKVYCSKYNEALGAWVAVSELSTSKQKACQKDKLSTNDNSNSPLFGIQVFRKSLMTTLLIAMGFPIASWAACTDTASVASATGGSTCTATLSNYSSSSSPVISALGTGSVLNVTSDVTVDNSSVDFFVAHYGVVAGTGGVINFDGDVQINANNITSGIYLTGGDVTVAKDLIIDASASSNLGRGVIMDGGTISVQGNTRIHTGGSTAADGIYVTANGGSYESLGSDNVITSDTGAAINLNEGAGVVTLGSAIADMPTGVVGVDVESGTVTGWSGIYTGVNNSSDQTVDTYIRIGSGADITGTTGSGIDANHFGTSGNIVIIQNGGSIYGKRDGIQGTAYGDVTITQNGGSITGVDTYGVQASSVNGQASVIQNGGSISGGTYGVYLGANDTSDGTSFIQTGGNVVGGTFGVYSQTYKDGIITQSSGSIIGGIYGVYAHNGSGNIEIGQSNDGTIVASGDASGNGLGIVAYNASTTGSNSITTAGTVSGLSTAIYSISQNGYDINIDGGTVSATAPTRGTIRVVDATGGTVDIAAGATVTAPSHDAIVLRDGDANKDDIDEIGGNMVVTTAGNVTGTAILNLGNDTFNLKGGDWNGNIYLDGQTASVDDGDDTFNWTDGALHSGVYGANGSDTFNISSATYDGSQILDGGDDTSTADGWIDTLNFSGINATTDGANLLNWEAMNLDNGSTLTLTGSSLTVGDLTAGTGISLANGSTLNTDSIALTSNMNIDSSSKFAISGATTVTGAVTNAGTIDLTTNSDTNQSLTIDGNYTGNNGTIKMNTVWNAPGGANGEDSSSDTVSITGNADGNTTIVPVSANGTTAVIDGNVQQVAEVINTVPVVTVAGTSASDTFTGTAQTTGATEVQLASRVTDTGATEYYWTMEAAKNIVTPSVPGYVQMPHANLETGYESIGTLHERQSENQTLAWDDCGQCGKNVSQQAWSRVFGKHLEQDGKTRFNTDSDIYGWQLGYDFSAREHANGAHSLTGGYITYAHTITDFADRYRAVNGVVNDDKYTGKGHSDDLGLGATYTYYTANGSYLDLVGQAAYIRNRYQSRDGVDVTQNGWRAAASAEVGRPFALGHQSESQGGWLIEPQAQLIYQYAHLNDFNDGTRHVSQEDASGLRGRIGVRLAHNSPSQNNKTKTFYATANVWHDFVNPQAVNIGADSVSEHYGSTWGEVGVGMQMPISKSSYVFADARYERDLGGSAKRDGYRGNIGIKYTW